MSFQMQPQLPPGQAPSQPTDQASSWLASFMGLSSMFGVGSSLKLLVLGSLIETGRRFCWWLIERFRIQYSITAQFNEGDPAYEWIVLFITQERVWKRSREFVVSAKNSQRKWALFKWRGYWLELKRSHDRGAVNVHGVQNTGRIYVTIYTLDMHILSQLVEEARRRYAEVNRPHVVIHLIDSRRFNGIQLWNNVKRKVRRPLSSIILPAGLLDSLVEDAQEFLNTEDWYLGAGIPHRRGYLLHGPPGTGKTSTIYALAGALNLEIYSLSLASNHRVERPQNGIFLIEDIDCAFPSREDEEDEFSTSYPDPRLNPNALRPARAARLVTMSGLLNVIDGVGSEEGKLFFATTNYIDRLDAALLRPGRIDRKIEYALSTTEQTRALFVRFFPATRFPELETESEKHPLAELAARFAAAVPPQEFSTAELQGFLQGYKTRPVEAAQDVTAWVEAERLGRQAREAREELRKKKAQLRMQSQMGEGFGMPATNVVRPHGAHAVNASPTATVPPAEGSATAGVSATAQ
ncbi:P-loop containing nucleoside triphosphate hydrolase protein [Mycena rosella]|uniref:P-loop containing nucleoside triphosphate hydrolase protein n=1 Tax=Mycena rosella TaxID=1033263 RepID=A0AAD7DTS7_MYCRO|nr:P-loop containing nucleoside triphosphate hydrolase protein [Mycena rosella]